jgi:hypothetical protein
MGDEPIRQEGFVVSQEGGFGWMEFYPTRIAAEKAAVQMLESNLPTYVTPVVRYSTRTIDHLKIRHHDPETE